MNVLPPRMCQILQLSVTKSISKSLLLARPNSTSKCGKGLKRNAMEALEARAGLPESKHYSPKSFTNTTLTSPLTKELLADGCPQRRILAAPSSEQAQGISHGGWDKSSQKNSWITSGAISDLLSQSRGHTWTNGREA